MDELQSLMRRRHWKKLEDALKMHYTFLLEGIQNCSYSQDECEILAKVVQSVVERTRDETLKASLAMDFGNFVVLTLEPPSSKFIPQFVRTPEGRCYVCLEDFNDQDFILVCDHATLKPVAHMPCHNVWSRLNV